MNSTAPSQVEDATMNFMDLVVVAVVVMIITMIMIVVVMIMTAVIIHRRAADRRIKPADVVRHRIMITAAHRHDHRAAGADHHQIIDYDWFFIVVLYLYSLESRLSC